MRIGDAIIDDGNTLASAFEKPRQPVARLFRPYDQRIGDAGQRPPRPVTIGIEERLEPANDVWLRRHEQEIAGVRKTFDS